MLYYLCANYAEPDKYCFQSRPCVTVSVCVCICLSECCLWHCFMVIQNRINILNPGVGFGLRDQILDPTLALKA